MLPVGGLLHYTAIHNSHCNVSSADHQKDHNNGLFSMLRLGLRLILA